MMRPERYVVIASVVLAGFCVGQMPTGGGVPGGGGVTMPSSFDASGSGAKPQQDDPAHRGETANPQLLGMEIPLMDPASDTVKYNGGYFDVGNNAVVRAAFEKYLEQTPDDTDEARRYRKLMNDILKQTQRAGREKKYAVGGEVLIKIGKGLYKASEYQGDGQQSGTLASAIVSALDVERKVLEREQQNQKLEKEMDELLERADQMENRNQIRREIKTANTVNPVGKGGKGGGRGNVARLDTHSIAHAVKKTAKHEATQAANTAANAAALAAAKVNYQALLVSMLMERRFDHVVIGARVYRHIFRDGDSRVALDKESRAYELFQGNAGLPPTVNSIDSAASNARREVDQSMDAVYGMLARNKLAQATQHLIEAVAIGEFMQSVATFPAEDRRRIAKYWNLRKRALTALNARDYATVEAVAAQMKEMDADFDDSLLLSYTSGKKRQSDLALRNAKKALKNGDEEGFNKYIEEAGMIWPRNPNLEKGEEIIEEYDAGDDVKKEFARLYEGKEYRRIAREREHFKIVNTDPDLAKKYEEVITLVMKMDGMLEQIKEVAQQDATIGPCMAYEKLIEWREDDENFANDTEMTLALRDFEAKAHDFVRALEDGKTCEKSGEFGSALSCYYRAQCKHPQSTLARKGIKRVTGVIVGASYD